MNREEIQQATEMMDAEERLAAAKEAVRADVCSECGRPAPSSADNEAQAELNEAKEAIFALRVAAAERNPAPEGSATPETVQATTTQER